MKTFDIEIKVEDDDTCSEECPNFGEAFDNSFCELFAVQMFGKERCQQCMACEENGHNTRESI